MTGRTEFETFVRLFLPRQGKGSKKIENYVPFFKLAARGRASEALRPQDNLIPLEGELV
jgi:hypothetical protein